MSHPVSHLLICESCESQFDPDDYEANECPTTTCAYCELRFCLECFEKTMCSFGTNKEPNHSEFVAVK